MNLKTTALALATSLLLASTVQASPLYGANGSLYAIDSTDGSHTVIDSGNSAYRLGLAYNGLTNTMYSVGPFDGVLSTLDLSNGNTTPVGPSNGYQMTGLTFSSDFSTLYSLNFNGGGLLAVNPLTGSATLIGGGGNGMLDLATRSDGTIFGGGFGGIGTFNTSTGAKTAIGGSLDWTAIAFNEFDVLYGIEIGSDALYTIDTFTGAATLVGGDIGDDVRGMAFVYGSSNSVPDTGGTVMLLGLAMAGLFAGGRRLTRV